MSSSPISAAMVTGQALLLSDVTVSGGSIYWVEARPHENGRCVIVQSAAGGVPRDVLPPPFSARTKVHEYGGGTFAVHPDSGIYFSNFADQRIYRADLSADASVRAISPPSGARHADYAIDVSRSRLLCVREVHGDGPPANEIASIDLRTGRDCALRLHGRDFYSSPRLSPDGRRLAWLTWDHPRMPWIGSELWVAQMSASGEVGEQTLVAGGTDESICQPEWCPDGTLWFLSDRTGWWNLWRHGGGGLEAMLAMDADFAQPHWRFGQSTYTFLSPGRMICTFVRDGSSRLGMLDLATRHFELMECPFTDIAYLRSGDGLIAFRGASETDSPAIVTFDPQHREFAVVRSSATFDPDVRRHFSRPQSIRFPTNDGHTAHAFFYPPADGETGPPPLIVRVHGGPTAAASSALDLRVQYWTSRGFAFVDVNHRGSSGFGRAFRLALRERWGIAEVEDCISAVAALVERGLADPKRVAICGESAGGFTVLSALAQSGVFCAGTSYYGVSDLETLRNATHKFESRYLDWLVAPYPEGVAEFTRRSPLGHAGSIRTPLLLLHGLDDRVVPPEQSTLLASQLAPGTVWHLQFAGEGHGFRQAETIERCLDAEVRFYTTVFADGTDR